MSDGYFCRFVTYLAHTCINAFYLSDAAPRSLEHNPESTVINSADCFRRFKPICSLGISAFSALVVTDDNRAVFTYLSLTYLLTY